MAKGRLTERMRVHTRDTTVDAEAGARVVWVDYAKGICIVAVVMMYATHHVQQILHSEGWMAHVVRFAQPFRMPDFFLISGLFVWRVIDRPLRRFIDTKVLYFAYFYAVWVTFRFSFTDLTRAYHEGSLITEYLRLFVEPPSGPLWFIYILALFFVTARLLRNWHPGIVLALGVGLQLADLHTGITLLDKFACYFVFFHGGHLLAQRLFGFACWAQSHPAITVLLLGGWFLLNAWAVHENALALPGARLLLGFAGAVAVMLVATLCGRTSWLDSLRWLGSHSIVIYLGFSIPLGVMRLFIHHAAGILDPGTVALIASLGCIAGAALLYLLLRRTPLRFLYTRPAWTRLAPLRPTRGYA